MVETDFTVTATVTTPTSGTQPISSDTVLVPHASEASAAQLRERLGLLARLIFCLGVFFLLAGLLHRFAFFGAGLLAGQAPDGLLITHLGVLGLQASVWLVLRSRNWHERSLAWFDALLVLGTLTGLAFQSRQIGAHLNHQPHMLAILATHALLTLRAVFVPSRPVYTLFIGCVAAAPALTVAFLEGPASGYGYETLSFTAIWCAAAIAISVFTSRVLYGLRKSVAQARQLGQYVIERKLGSGGMGEVYLARHTLLRRATAVKLLPAERAGRNTIARFEREVTATSRLSHPNTVAIYDYGRTLDGVFYYAMEYLDGCDLQRLVETHGPLEPSRVVHILAQIAGALAEAHSVGLVHRDLKPANVFLCERGGIPDTVKVLDFGLVKDTSDASDSRLHTELNALMGTPAYLSPEAITAPESVDAQSDLYALGALAYFLLTGREVFQASSVIALCLAHLHQTPERPSLRVATGVPADLEALVLQCLEKSPPARPASASALRRALLACDVPAWCVEAAAPSAPQREASSELTRTARINHQAAC
jgi:eukaryotic-like serine/threonine-protein kinase